LEDLDEIDSRECEEKAQDYLKNAYLASNWNSV